jgi:hypothetical protein
MLYFASESMTKYKILCTLDGSVREWGCAYITASNYIGISNSGEN